MAEQLLEPYASLVSACDIPKLLWTWRVDPPLYQPSQNNPPLLTLFPNDSLSKPQLATTKAKPLAGHSRAICPSLVGFAFSVVFAMVWLLYVLPRISYDVVFEVSYVKKLDKSIDFGCFQSFFLANLYLSSCDKVRFCVSFSVVILFWRYGNQESTIFFRFANLNFFVYYFSDYLLASYI